MLTLDEVKQSLPAHLKTAATQSLTDQLNNISADPEAARNIRENFVSYTSVLREGRFKTEDYMNAVAYVSFKLMSHTNQEAYKRTFPGRYKLLVAGGKTDKEISAYVAAYNKGKLVNLIWEQTLIPIWVMNQDAVHKAVNVNTSIMLDQDVSAKVRVEAANSILTHLRKPESKQVDLNLGIQEASGMNELKDMLANLAQKQQSAIATGITTKEIAHQDLYQKPQEVIDITPTDTTPQHTKAKPVEEPVAEKTNLGPNPLTSFKPSSDS